MSRFFDGTDDQMVYDGVVVPQVNGAHTLLVVARIMRVADDTWESFIETETFAAGAAATLGRRTSGNLYWAQGSTSTDVVAATDSDNWCVFAATKTAGSSIPRLHKCVIGGANTHTDHGGAALAASASIAGGLIRLGGNDDFANMRLAAAAIFNKVLTDGEIDGIDTALTTASIAALDPTWLVDDSDAFATDLTANTLDRTSITGTADDGDDPAGWVYGVGPPPTLGVELPDYTRFPRHRLRKEVVA